MAYETKKVVARVVFRRTLRNTRNGNPMWEITPSDEKGEWHRYRTMNDSHGVYALFNGDWEKNQEWHLRMYRGDWRILGNEQSVK